MKPFLNLLAFLLFFSVSARAEIWDGQYRVLTALEDIKPENLKNANHKVVAVDIHDPHIRHEIPLASVLGYIIPEGRLEGYDSKDSSVGMQSFRLSPFLSRKDSNANLAFTGVTPSLIESVEDISEIAFEGSGWKKIRVRYRRLLEGPLLTVDTFVGVEKYDRYIEPFFNKFSDTNDSAKTLVPKIKYNPSSLTDFSKLQAILSSDTPLVDARTLIKDGCPGLSLSGYIIDEVDNHPEKLFIKNHPEGKLDLIAIPSHCFLKFNKVMRLKKPLMATFYEDGTSETKEVAGTNDLVLQMGRDAHNIFLTKLGDPEGTVYPIPLQKLPTLAHDLLNVSDPTRPVTLDFLTAQHLKQGQFAGKKKKIYKPKEGVSSINVIPALDGNKAGGNSETAMKVGPKTEIEFINDGQHAMDYASLVRIIGKLYYVNQKDLEDKKKFFLIINGEEEDGLLDPPELPDVGEEPVQTSEPEVSHENVTSNSHDDTNMPEGYSFNKAKSPAILDERSEKICGRRSGAQAKRYSYEAALKNSKVTSLTQACLKAAEGVPGISPQVLLASMQIESHFRSSDENTGEMHDIPGKDRAAREAHVKSKGKSVWGKGPCQLGPAESKAAGLDWSGAYSAAKEKQTNSVWNPRACPKGMVIIMNSKIKQISVLEGKFNKKIGDEIAQLKKSNGSPARIAELQKLKLNPGTLVNFVMGRQGAQGEAERERYLLGMYNRGMRPILSLLAFYVNKKKLPANYGQLFTPEASVWPKALSNIKPDGFDAPMDVSGPLLRGTYTKNGVFKQSGEHKINRGHVWRAARLCGASSTPPAIVEGFKLLLGQKSGVL